MYIPPTKQQIIEKSREYYKQVVKEAKPQPFILNVSLTSNPFIKDRDSFKFLKFQLADYNKRIERGEVKDTYEMLSFQKLHSMLSDLAQIDSRQDQLTALEDLFAWYKEQQRLIEQRHDQGFIRYEMSKEYRDVLKYVPEKKVEEEEQELNIPFYMIERVIEPYRRNWRSLHPELENPNKRLKEYKRKTINIATFSDNKEEVKPPRVLYPVPPKYEEPKEEEHEEKPPQEGQPVAPADGTVPADGQPPADGAPGEENPNPQGEPAQPDMGGFGQQPQQPDEQEPPEEVPDKLRPKNPIYSEAISTDKQKKYKQTYQFYLGNDTKEQRNMQLRYIRKYHDSLRKQKEDINQIEIAHDWAKRKSKITKDFQKKLEEMKFKPNLTFSKQPVAPEEKINIQDEIKFGFTTMARNKPRMNNQFDLSYSELPPIANQTFDEKSMRRDRLNSLKNKFGKLLNLAETEDRQSAPSLCQFTARRRGLSEIIRNHSHSKERLFQLEEVSKIKEKLTKVKVNINIKALSKGLCLPENEQYFAETERQYPNKDLPSNPNMVETKKKKKKKK